MKKIVIFFMLLIALAFAGVKFYTNKISKEIEARLAMIESYQGVSIENKIQNVDIFNSDLQFDVVINKNAINSYFSIDDESGVKNDLRFGVSSKIKHSVANLTDGVQVYGDVQMLSSELVKLSSELFGTTKPIKFSILDKIGGEKSLNLTLLKIDKKVENINLDVADSFMDFKFNDKYEILQTDIRNDFIKVGNNDMSLAIEKIGYDIKYDEPYNIDKMMNNVFENLSVKTNIDKISLKFANQLFEINSIKDQSKQLVDSETIKALSEGTIGSISYGDGGTNYKFKDFVINSRVENIDKIALSEILNSKTKDSEKYIKEVMDSVVKILQRGPKIFYDKLNFKNMQEKNLISNFEFSIKPTNFIGSEFLNEQFLRSINLQGVIAMDTTPGEFFFSNDESQKHTINYMLIENGIFVKNGEKYESKISYDADEMDFIFNDKVSLKRLFMANF